ncbi:hypothetical protein A2160_02200 [Candidatus Beckwithbacteria bacterium RBG_13_42_9]|uniref:AB hydrolase-1 domain-containing protein n=1 Tax=Candidatus Beckwithbacteria bacterium RBG_13_42_9 TaxID=1797457 RepID=A0A1F5E7K5_9BACT|nr:MAG: hypothetical protein A2160_02200 [Candidatus Beckwithbacteria bacterium RBG_13_42_9]
MAQDTLIILHGWTRHHERWQTLIKILRHYGYQVVYLKLPGFTSLPLSRVWTIIDYAGWIKFFLDEQKIKTFSLIGHSNGGRIAAFFAAQNPKGLKKLILIDSAGVKNKYSFKRTILFPLAKIGNLFFAIPGIAYFRDIARSWLYRIAGEKDYFEAEPKLAKTMVGLINLDLVPYLGKIAHPVLLIWGAQDVTTPLKDALIFKKEVKKARLTVFPGGKHTLPYDKPLLVAREIIDFLKSN